MASTVTLAAIAKNEGRYIAEWVAHNLAIGFTRIIVFDNESTDETGDIVERISQQDQRISRIYWPSGSHGSPQVAAYTKALTLIDTDWVAFFDIDEFINPFSYDTLPSYLDQLPDDVASVHVNWRGFGSGGRTDPNYDLVTRTFFHCSSAAAGNNRHYKTLARSKLAEAAFVHDILTSSGRRVLSDLREFEHLHNGIADRVVYHGIQLNHYQCKTYPEFKERMERGDANVAPGSPHRKRDGSFERYKQYDCNEEFDDKILRYDARFLEEYKRIIEIIARQD